MTLRSEKIALVTGAGSGIGHATALALLQAGYRVACGYNHNRAGAAKIEASHSGAFAAKIDIASRTSVKRAIAASAKHFGRGFDVVVNNAALVQEKPFETITDADWDRMLAINLRGAFIVAQECLPGMLRRKWGRIINITSIGGQWGGMRQVHYAAAKAGLINFTHSLARLYSGDGVTANAIAPGLVATDMIARELKSKAGKKKAAQIPVGRIAEPEEIAAGVVYLASDAADYVTGQTLNINGGMLMS
ncbi:MAG TPA: 3-oxoacyl-ACP reductase family protein, partial [Rhizomicrobium sp.]|nr:3-oxoacyl-ACP reductase family protein [Rhizomicrobium sp.]